MTTTNSALTPMLRQYQELKRQHPGALLFFRLGDFYELFFEDAITGARELEITLTARHKERGQPVPMCGVPHHAVASYVARLIRKGYRVAICEQTEDPSKAKKLVRREVVRVITPGTAIDPHLVEAKESVYLAALCGAGDTYGAAFLDLSTGDFRCTEVSGPDAWARVRSDIESYAPRELLFPRSLAPLVREAYTGGTTHTAPLPLEPEGQDEDESPVARIMPAEHAATRSEGLPLTPLEDWLWEPTSCASLLLEQFGARTLEGYGLGGKVAAVAAAGACLRYARETQRAAAAHVTDISFFETHDHLVIDAVTCRNLELVESQGGGGRGASLLNVIDATVTGMGARLLRSWMLRPSVRRGEIEARLSAVEDLHRSQMRRDRTRALLKDVSDLERLVGRINMGTATPRDLVALRRSLNQVPAIRKALSDAEASLLQVVVENADELTDVRELIGRALCDDPPANFNDGGVVREGFDVELDELRSVSRDAKQTIAAIESRERARSGINSLRVRFNNVFGYFIEVSKSVAARVPADYERRQTLANAERYTTPELKEWEQKVLGAEGRILEIETRIFGEVRAQVAQETRRLQTTARALSVLDVLASLAEIAARRRYQKPTLHDGDELEIKGGRHPVIEALGDTTFVPNDLSMNGSTERLLIITGPNMGGKCLGGDTLVFTNRGLVRLSSLSPENARTGEFSEISCRVKARAGVSDATHFYTGGNKAIVRVKTRYGFEIEGTPEHRLWIRESDGVERWKCMGEIRHGDTVAIDRLLDIWGEKTGTSYAKPEHLGRAKSHSLPEVLDVDLSYMMGLLIGDGTLTYRDAVALTTADDFIAEEFGRIARKHFGYVVSGAARKLCYRIHSRQIRDFFNGLGLAYARAHEKHVPHSILEGPKHVVRAFLQGLFDTDGWAANSQAKVFLATSSQALAREVQLLLLNFGIVASLRVKKTLRRPSYQVGMYGAEAIRFHQEVGFRLPRKQARQELAPASRRPNIGIPHLAGILKDAQLRIAATHGKPFSLKKNKSVNSIFYTYVPNGKNISYSKLDELVSFCKSNDIDCGELESIQRQRYFYDTVVSLEAAEAEVFDLNVERDHSYVANGFVSHNSTLLRQTALICLLAQMGSFVPAERARLPLLDRIWTRVGASDDLSRGRSTFMVEMTETAAILHNATPRSLVLLDEIGRGTATFDGLSIAWAVAEHLHDSPEHSAKTLFATHYHELTELAERLPGAQNYQIRVAEREGEVIFLYKIERGRASKSYGIEVARLAGLPPAVLARAREVLTKLERYELDVFAEEGDAAAKAATAAPSSVEDGANGKDALGRAAARLGRRALAAQITLFDSVNQSLLDELRGLDVETLTGDEARQLLLGLRNRIV